MDDLSKYLKRNRFAVICAAGIVVIGGCFLVYQASLKSSQNKAQYSVENTNDALVPPSDNDDNTSTSITDDPSNNSSNGHTSEPVTDPPVAPSNDAQAQTDKLLGTDVDWHTYKDDDDDDDDDNKQINDNNDNDQASSSIKFPVQVFIRIRPLIKEEIDGDHKEIEYNPKFIKKTQSTSINIVDITKKVRQSAIKKKKKKNDKKALKKFKGFRRILSKNDDNHETFKQCILPSIPQIFNSNTVCLFAYGHTGSGKTHTVLGYDENTSPGMYRLTAKYIGEQLVNINKDLDNDSQILLSCRFAELYQGKMRDLFGNLVECFVREDDKGNINIRGPTIKDNATGQVKVQPLTPVYIKQDESIKLINRVTESLKYRTTGSSAIHDQSSRSHVFLEMELVTNQLIAAREDLLQSEAEIVPVGKRRDDLLIEIQYAQFFKDPVDDKWKPNPNYVEPKDKRDELNVVQKKFTVLDNIIKEKENKILEIIQNSNKCITGTIVFVDLAGNEYGNESKNIKNDNKIQAAERAEINKSLLSLKECIRALHSKKSHVPYRDSKLTMVLRPHLKGINSTAIMIANMSPSTEHIKKTYNTLSYSQLVAQA